MGWLGLRGDLVSAGDPTDNSSWDTPDGVTHGTFSLVVSAPGATVYSLDLVRGGSGGEWDTKDGNGTWGLGVTRGRSGRLLNDTPSSSVTIAIGKNGTLKVTLHADEDVGGGPDFSSGSDFTLTACFDAILSDCVASNTVTIP